jgi:uncharacterized protein (TIGR02145 family)
MIKNVLFAVLLILASFTFSQTVTIGSQVWMTKNLDVDKFRNGDPIPQANTNEEWETAGKNGQPAWCYHKYSKDNLYGKLYNWYAVNDQRGLAPIGWQIPSDTEWSVLIDYLGGKDVAGTKMKSTKGWSNDGNGNNQSGFSGLPGDYRNGLLGDYVMTGGGFYGYWWSSTESNKRHAWYRTLGWNHENVERSDFHNKETGMSVRCLKD